MCLLTVQELIAAEEAAGIPRNRVVIGGFSQGGAVALYSAFAEEKPPVAGVLALSTWLPLAGSLKVYMYMYILTNENPMLITLNLLAGT